MRLIGLIAGVFLMLLGVIGIAAPHALIALARSVNTPVGLYGIAAVRIVLGLVFVLGARASRVPTMIRALGIIVIIAGLTTPWFGVDRTRAILDWWAGAGLPVLRLTFGVAIAIGGFLVYAFRSPAPPR